MADRRVVVLAATLVTFLMVLSSMGLISGAAGARAPAHGPSSLATSTASAAIPGPATPYGTPPKLATPLANPSPHGASAPSSAPPSPLGINPAVVAAHRMIANHQLNPSTVFFPTQNPAITSSHPGALASLYSMGTPSPMGLSDIGTGSAGTYVYNSSSFESSITVNSFQDYNPGYAGFDAPPNYMTWQLNTVTVNTSYPGSTTGSFWIQNVVHFNGTAFQFENNIWNFSSPTSGMQTGTLLSYGGQIVPGVFYYVYGPSFTVQYPFTLDLFNNISTAGGHPNVYFNYSLSNTTTGPHSGSFDHVVFNGAVVPTAPPMFEVNGKKYAPITPAGPIFYDAELIFGGNGGGANAIITGLNGSATLSSWNKTAGAYQSVRSAYDYGVDTGETADGVAASYRGTTEYLSQGPSFINGLWNTSDGPLGVHASPGWINVDLHGLPNYGFVFGTNQSAYSYSRAVTQNYSYAPSLVTGETITHLPPPRAGDPYIFTGYANGYGQSNLTVSDNTSGSATFPSFVANTRSFDTPVYLSSDAQAIAFGASGVSGVTYSPTAHTLWINSTKAFVGKPFYQISDFRFPNFMLFAADNLTVNVSLNHFIQDPSSFAYYKYNSYRGPPTYTDYAYLSQGYYFNYGSGKFSIANTSVIGSVGLYTALLGSFIALPAVEFWQTSGSQASGITTAGGSFGVDVENSTFATLRNIDGQSGANAIAVLGSGFVSATNISANGTLPAIGLAPPVPTWGAAINDSGFVVINGLTATNNSLWIEATNVVYLTVENASAANDVQANFGPSGAFGFLGFFSNGVGLTLHNIQLANSTGFLGAAVDIEHFLGTTLTNISVTGVNPAGLAPNVTGTSILGIVIDGFGNVSEFVNVSHLSSSYGAAGVLGIRILNVTVQEVAAGPGSSGALFEAVVNITEWNLSAGALGAIGTFVFSALNVAIWNVTSGSGSLGAYVALATNFNGWNFNGTSPSLGAAYFTNHEFVGVIPNAVVGASGNTNELIYNVAALNYAFGVQDNGSTNELIRNVTAWNGGTGVALNGNSAATVASVFAYGNQFGATFAATTSVVVTSSTFEGSSSFGVSVTGGSSFLAYGNNFVANNGASTAGAYSASHVQASVTSSTGPSFTFGAIGNYWSDWPGAGAYIINSVLSDTAPFVLVISNWLEFNETGLPASLAWGFTLDTIPYTTSAPLVYIPSWTLAHASLGFVVNPPAGWTPTPASGTVTYTGANQTTTISFARAHFTVAFQATGLPSGTTWSVTFNGTTMQDTTSGGTGTISYSVFAGSYTYTVGAVANYNAAPSNGTVAVTTSNVNVAIVFTHVPVQYAVTFTETGLPSGTNWSVTLGSGVLSSTGTTIAFSELNGTYSYTVGTVAGYTATPRVGTVTVSGLAQNVGVSWSLTPPTTYAVTFTETGLPTGTNWTVTLGGVTHYSTTASIVFNEPNGTYTYSIPTVAGYAPGTAGANVMVAGMGSTVSVAFAAVPPAKYTLTFTESGLPSGTVWSVTIGGVIHSSNTTTITFLEVNGTYPYTVGTVTGYTFSPSSGSVVVLGSTPAAVAVSFAPSSGGSSPAGGLTNLDWLIIGIVIALIVVGLIVALARRGGRAPPATTTTETTTETTTTAPAPWSEETPPPGAN
jgi:Thermopsin